MYCIRYTEGKSVYVDLNVLNLQSRVPHVSLTSVGAKAEAKSEVHKKSLKIRIYDSDMVRIFAKLQHSHEY